MDGELDLERIGFGSQQRLLAGLKRLTGPLPDTGSAGSGRPVERAPSFPDGPLKEAEGILSTDPKKCVVLAVGSSNTLAILESEFKTASKCSSRTARMSNFSGPESNTREAKSDELSSLGIQRK